MDTNGNVTLGRIYACIDGDHRYGILLKVVTNGLGAVLVQATSTSPVGGMDGGTSETFDDTRTVQAWSLKTVTATELVAYLRKAFKKIDGGTIARYGTPSKRFTWTTKHGTQNGLSIKLAAEALRLAGGL